mmetsp:Transcript_38258/g.90775  ORF Transcript_38258/g.90775 Transcript_38258/m.90775 type:complete len:263 (+) Transcript_38258:251-1039(+)
MPPRISASSFVCSALRSLRASICVMSTTRRSGLRPTAAPAVAVRPGGSSSPWEEGGGAAGGSLWGDGGPSGHHRPSQPRTQSSSLLPHHRSGRRSPPQLARKQPCAGLSGRSPPGPRSSGAPGAGGSAFRAHHVPPQPRLQARGPSWHVAFASEPSPQPPREHRPTGAAMGRPGVGVGAASARRASHHSPPQASVQISTPPAHQSGRPPLCSPPHPPRLQKPRPGSAAAPPPPPCGVGVGPSATAPAGAAATGSTHMTFGKR